MKKNVSKLWNDATEVVPRGEFIALSVYVRKGNLSIQSAQFLP